MLKFRKKPVVIEAIQLSPDNLNEVRDFLGGEAKRNLDFAINYTQHSVTIHTLEGMMTGQVGDWIIKGVKGEFYPIKNDIFRETYEAEDATQK